jgi:hypothetical protein
VVSARPGPGASGASPTTASAGLRARARAGFCPSPALGSVPRPSDAKERWKHEPKDPPYQLLLAAQAPFDLLDQGLGQLQLLEGLCEGTHGPLRLGVVALEALVGVATTALSGVGLAFLIRFGPAHGVCLHTVGAILRVWRQPWPRSHAIPPTFMTLQAQTRIDGSLEVNTETSGHCFHRRLMNSQGMLWWLLDQGKA